MRDSFTNPDAVALNNPEPTTYRLFLQHAQERADSFAQNGERYCRESEDGDTGSPIWWETDHIGKVQIKRDQAALLAYTDLIDFRIAGTAKSLVQNGLKVMICPGEQGH